MPLDEAYLAWLYSQVGSVTVRNRSKTYWKLLRLLHKKEFSWSDIETDGNRAQDGKDLRKEFAEETGRRNVDAEWMDRPCTFLELLIALSFKLAWDGDGMTQTEWFWELIANLGLTECTDAHPPEEAIIDHILNKVINRDYAPNGAGGLFPLKNWTDAALDRRVVELWYQAEDYLLERIRI